MDDLDVIVPSVLAGERLDRAVAVLTELPRAAIAQLLTNGLVSLDGRETTKPSRKVVEGQRVQVRLPEVGEGAPSAEPGIAFEVLYEDADIVVVDKPAGLVVHPGAGHTDGTLVNGLLNRYPDMIETHPGDPMRPGIVHRLDAGTSGLLVVARTQDAYLFLVDAIQQRSVERRYLTLVWGDLQPSTGMVDAPIGRAEADRTKMTVSAGGRSARTRYSVIARHDDPHLSLVVATLETGRTHQIRVHFAAIEHPVVGDGRYGGVRQGLEMTRPFLHARSLRFRHPRTGAELYIESTLPDDLRSVVAQLGMGLSGIE